MPELPEVEAARTLLGEHCTGKRITGVFALEAGGGPRAGSFDNIVFDDTAADAAAVVAGLRGKTLVGVHRKGKQLWLELSSPPHLLGHFGMTGAFVVRGVAAARYKSFKVEEESWPPRFTKLELVLDGARVAFCDPRRLGRLRLCADPVHSSPWRDLAPDPMHAPPSAAAVRAALASKGCAVKALLLDQEALVSGVGNWIADEVLYQAGVHPAAVCRTLSDAQADAIRESLLLVLRTACAVGADSSRFPKEWLFHHRWGKGKGTARVPGAAGGPITFLTVGGRTSAVVTGRQRMGQRPKVAAEAAPTEGAAAGGKAPKESAARRKRPRGGT